MHRRRTLIFVTVAFAAIVSSAVIRALADAGVAYASEMKAELDTAIPRGTSVDGARSELSRRGFRVSEIRDSSLADQGKVREHLDYLHGDMSEGAIVKRRWQVAAVFHDGAITEIVVNVGLIGP